YVKSNAIDFQYVMRMKCDSSHFVRSSANLKSRLFSETSPQSSAHNNGAHIKEDRNFLEYIFFNQICEIIYCQYVMRMKCDSSHFVRSSANLKSRSELSPQVFGKLITARVSWRIDIFLINQICEIIYCHKVMRMKSDSSHFVRSSENLK
ncbi:Unknown protein, partial [Striga hermonthica]